MTPLVGLAALVVVALLIVNGNVKVTVGIQRKPQPAKPRKPKEGAE